MPSPAANDSYSGVAVGFFGRSPQQTMIGFEGDELAWTSIWSS